MNRPLHFVNSTYRCQCFLQSTAWTQTLMPSSREANRKRMMANLVLLLVPEYQSTENGNKNSLVWLFYLIN